MTTTYREIRLAGLDDAMAFAKEHGSAAAPDRVCHRLSLSAHQGDETVGFALCLEEAGRCVIELALTDAAAEQGLAKPLADTALRKMQAAGVGTARVRSLNDGGAERLWEVSNWLDRVPSCGADPDAAGAVDGGDRADTGPQDGADAAAEGPAAEPAQAV